MNDTLKVLAQRRSIRSYSNQPVTDDEKDAILQATLRAPTAGNLMLYSIIEVDDQTIKDRLAISCDHQSFIAKAPYVLLFLADYQRWLDYFDLCGAFKRANELRRPHRQPQVGDLLLACCDALIAAQTAVIAAESMGIGSCYIGDILERYELHQGLFDLPPYVLPITMVCFGHPAKGVAGKMTTRFPQDAIVHRNRYHRFNPQELETIFRGTEQHFSASTHPTEFLNAGQACFFRKFMAEFTIEMNRSVKTMLENWG